MMPDAPLLRAAVVFYILHILLHHKIALVMLMAFGAIGCVAWAVARGDIPFSFHILYFPLAVYGVVSSVSSVASGRTIHQWGEPVLWFKMLIFPAAIILYRSVPRLKDWMIYAWALLGGGSSIWALIQYIFLGRRGLDHRISGPSSHVMTFSGILLPLALMFLILWWHEKKPLYLIVTILCNVTLLLTFTRSVWIGWLVAMFLMLMSKRTAVRWYAPAALLLFLTFLPIDLFSRVMSTFDLRQESNFDRIRMVEAGIEMIRDHPLLGVGPGNVKEQYALYRKHDAPRPRPPHLHNNPVQLWAERGVLGVGAYVLLLGLFVRECLKGRRGLDRVWSDVGLAAITGLTVAGLFEFNFGDTEVFFLTMNLMAFVAVRLERAEQPSNEAAPRSVESSGRPVVESSFSTT